jgi:hypothetical protein
VRDPRLVAHPEETGEHEPDPCNSRNHATRAWGARPHLQASCNYHGPYTCDTARVAESSASELVLEVSR